MDNYDRSNIKNICKYFVSKNSIPDNMLNSYKNYIDNNTDTNVPMITILIHLFIFIVPNLILPTRQSVDAIFFIIIYILFIMCTLYWLYDNSKNYKKFMQNKIDTYEDEFIHNEFKICTTFNYMNGFNYIKGPTKIYKHNNLIFDGEIFCNKKYCIFFTK